MIRILGFVIGAFLAVGVLLALVGTPDLERRNGGDARMDAAIENLKRKWEEPAATASAAAAPAGTPGDAAGAPAGDSAVGPVADTPGGMAADSSGDPAADPGAAAPETPASTPARAVAAAEPGWHAFWAPFRTEIAARGFVGRLEAVTGLDYRVTKLRTGAWQVAFAYQEAGDVDAGLEQIAAATGLDLASARP